MAILEAVEAGFPAHGSRARWARYVALVLATLVLAGGIYPSLYLGQLPHTHVFVGGPPPADWEDHQHENPLDYLFGPPVGSITPSVATGQDRPGNEKTPSWSDGRVVSVYSPAGALVVVTVLSYALLIPVGGWLGLIPLTLQFVSRPDRPSPRGAARPPTPPPRRLSA
jgi:hypothetical protein